MGDNQKDIQLSLGDRNSNQCLFIFNKTEKIVHASYVVTNLLPTQEPMRWNIREECHYLLRHALPLKDIQDMVRMKEYVEKIQTSIFSLLSLYEISSRSQVLSKMNCEVIRDELINLSKEVKSLCDVQQSTYGFHQEELSLGSKYASLIFDTNETLPEPEKTVSDMANQRRNPSLSNGKRTTSQKDKHIKDRLTNASRRNKIIQLIKDKKTVSIKDIAKNVKDCSTKTIQRELSALVSLGVLVKEGEKRWSIYRLK